MLDPTSLSANQGLASRSAHISDFMVRQRLIGIATSGVPNLNPIIITATAPTATRDGGNDRVNGVESMMWSRLLCRLTIQLMDSNETLKDIMSFLIDPANVMGNIPGNLTCTSCRLS